MKTKVIYYTRTGNAKRIAEKLGSKLGTEVIELKDQMDWSGFFGYMKAGYYSMTDKVVEYSLSSDLQKEEKLIVVAPLWAGNIAPAAKNFILAHGPKNIKLVVTSGGSKLNKDYGIDQLFSITERSKNEDAIIEELIK